jgi:hypothetical protein
MPTIVTRASKGSALTWTEGDANISNLNDAIDNIVSGTQAVGNATNATNINIASIDGNSSDLAMAVVLVANQATGNQQPHTDTGLSFNASTNALTATTFIGNATTATTATTATNANNINISTTTGNGGDATLSLVLVGAQTTGNQIPHIDTALSFDASTETLTTVGIQGTQIREGTIFNLGTTGGTITPNVASGNIQKITLSSNLTLNAFSNPITGQTLTLLVYGGVGYNTVTSTMLFAGGNKTLSGTTGCLDVITVTFTDGVYLASIARGFA